MQHWFKFGELLKEYQDVFSKGLPSGLPLVRAIDHARPISRPSYQLSHREALEVELQLTDYLSRGFIQSSSSPLALLILLVKKKDGSICMYVDYC